MPSQDRVDYSQKDPEEQLFEAVSMKDLQKVEKIIKDNPKVDLNCIDKDELTPLQHVCHNGHVEIARLLLDNGAGVNVTKRKDKYTPLMFATISSKPDLVKLLLERGVDTTALNCVNRTAAQMASFIGQSRIYMILSSWIPYEVSVKQYTVCRELEDKPRLPSEEMAKLLHDYIVDPTLHPAKTLLFIKENMNLLERASEYLYVLEDLSSKSIKPPRSEELLTLKYYYKSYFIDYCHKSLRAASKKSQGDNNRSFDVEAADKLVDTLIRKLIRHGGYTKLAKSNLAFLDRFVTDCIMKFPYTHLAIFKTMTFALSKRSPGVSVALSILNQTLDGPPGNNENTCAVCEGVDGSNKKCSRCKSIYYCGASCQKADWFQHKKVCKSPEEEPLIKGD